MEGTSEIFPTHLEVPLVLNAGIALLELDIWWNHSVLKNQDCLDKPSDASRSLQMADTGFQPLHDQWLLRRSDGPENSAHGLCLKRVAHPRPRAVRLEETCQSQIKASTLMRFTNKHLLGLAAGLCNAGSSSVLIGPRCANDCPDCVAITERLREHLYDENGESFAASMTNGTMVKSIRDAVGAVEAKGE